MKEKDKKNNNNKKKKKNKSENKNLEKRRKGIEKWGSAGEELNRR